MADVDRQQGGPSTSRRKKHTGKSKAQPANDWPRSGEPRPRASPRSNRHGDIDRDLVESSDDASDAHDAKASPRKQRRRRRPQPLNSTTSDTASDTTHPAKAPAPAMKGRSKSMRVPNASVPVHSSRRPTCIIEPADEDDVSPSGPSRPVSRQTIARRDMSPRSAHRYRSTPESRRSPRTSVSDSEDDTDATSDSDSEQVILPPRGKLPAAPMAPAVPSAPPTTAARSSYQERLMSPPEMVYEEEGDGTSRYAPSARHRSLSRPASSRQDPYRRPRDITVSGPPSLDETRRSRSRSKSARPSRRHYESDVYLSSRPASSFNNKRANAASSYSLDSSAKRSTFFGADFAAPPPARASHPEKPAERTTVCAKCRDSNTPVSRTVKLKCCHRMCHTCLRKVFKLSLTDPQQHMPPRCCTNDNIPAESVDKLFDSSFKQEWNHQFKQHAGRTPMTCPSRRCGELVKPEDMRLEGARWQGRCSRCRTKVCGSCNARWHHEPECPSDDNAALFTVEKATKREPWQRCYRCKTGVEVKDGRNHIVCRCGAELCPQCGGKWKSCECSFLTDDPFEVDTANLRANPFASRPPSPSPRDFRSDFAPPHTSITRPRPSSYEDDAHIRRLHEHQHHRDDHLARRMHSFDEFGHNGNHADLTRRREDYDFEAPEPRDRRRRAEIRDYGTPFVDEDYHRRAATVVAPSPPQAHVPAAPPPPHSAFEPPSRPSFDRAAPGFEYGSAARRGRDMRYASPERFDHYMPENYPAERRRAHSPDPWQGFPPEQRARSRDRRHTFPSESRPTSPEHWQPPTRYPSPERPTPAPEERRRAPSPDRRRASSLEQRLASRFKKESRQNPTAPIVPAGGVGPAGAVGALGPVGALSQLSPARAPPPPSRAATHIGASMPMAPMVPMAPMAPSVAHGGPPPAPSLRRHHTMDEDIYGPGVGMPGGGMPGGMPGSGVHGGGMPPPADWFGPPLPHGHPHGHPHSHPPPPGMAGGMGMPMMHHGHHPSMHDMAPAGMDPANGGSARAPHVRRRPPQAHREHTKYDIPRSSVLAGLGGMGRGAHRVHEWVNYVEPGAPDEIMNAAMH